MPKPQQEILSSTVFENKFVSDLRFLPL